MAQEASTCELISEFKRKQGGRLSKWERGRILFYCLMSPHRLASTPYIVDRTPNAVIVDSKQTDIIQCKLELCAFRYGLKWRNIPNGAMRKLRERAAYTTASL